MPKKTYVLDTNVYLTDATAISSFGNNDILIPLKVLEDSLNNKVTDSPSIKTCTCNSNPYEKL